MSDQTFIYWNKITDENNIAWLHIDNPDAGVNTLSSVVLKEFEVLLHELEQDEPAGVVIISDKPSGFFAGADVSEFIDLSEEQEAFIWVEYCQSLFTRFEELPCPTVALINGFCMGGGTELALACRYRIAEDDAKTRIGLPEIKLGIHPGYGGTVRCSRLLGPLASMDMMLTGRAMNARIARKTGLVDYIVPSRHMRNAAVQVILKNEPRPKRKLLHRFLSHRLIRPLLAQQMRKRIRAKADPSHYPAPYALIDLWEKYADSDRMMMNEARSISRLIGSNTAKNLIRVFFLQSGMKELGKQSAFKAAHVHVIGAGVMGGDIASWCALRGLTVTLQDQSPERISPAIKRAAKLFKKRLKIPMLVNAAMDRLIPDTEGNGVKNADVVIEAIFENLEAKQALFKDLELQVKESTLLCTNTSSIPLEEISSVLQDPSRLTGLHFFNPVEKMQLIEVVQGKNSQESLIADTASFATQIGKLPLKVKSSPGFLVNRILLPYLLEASYMVQEGIDPQIIDKKALEFGMPMGPIELADKVGLDICLSVAEILTTHFGGNVPDILNDKVASGNLGVKTERGFYEYSKGKKVKTSLDQQAKIPDDIQNRLVMRLLNEAVACLRESVVDSADMLDAGVIFGTGFSPFTGGPMQYLNSLDIEQTKQILGDFRKAYGERFEMDEGWNDLADKKSL